MDHKQLLINSSAAMDDFLGRYGEQGGDQAGQDLVIMGQMLDWAQEQAAGCFSTGEALLICEALVKAVANPMPAERLDQFIRSSVDEAEWAENLAHKWKVDLAELDTKMAALNMPQALALWHWTRLFWANPEWDHQKVAELFRTKP